METILIADDQEIVRSGVKMIIESFPEKYNIIEAATCTEVMQVFFGRKIHYTILDLFFGDGNIFSSIHQFIKHSNKAGILVYSMSAEKIYGRRLLKKGVHSFISKRAPIAELEKAICCLLKGEIYLSQAMKEDILMPVKSDLPENLVDSLSDRELEVVEYLTIGISSREIAEKMKLDITTVSTYRRRAFEKLDIHNNIELRDKLLLLKIDSGR
jgi:two-component system, NarL family, invasion response regulator UvrY